MKVSDCMTRDVKTLSPDSSVKDAADLMRRLNVGFVPVCEDDRVVGAITDRDIAVRCTALGHDPNRCQVSEAMSEDVVCVHPDTEVSHAADLMEKHKIRRLVVVDKNDSCIGVVSLGDLAVDTEDDRLSGEVLHEVSSPVRSR